MTPKNIQVTTKKYLNSEVRKIALGILREVA